MIYYSVCHLFLLHQINHSFKRALYTLHIFYRRSAHKLSHSHLALALQADLSKLTNYAPLDRISLSARAVRRCHHQPRITPRRANSCARNSYSVFLAIL